MSSCGCLHPFFVLIMRLWFISMRISQDENKLCNDNWNGVFKKLNGDLKCTKTHQHAILQIFSSIMVQFCIAQRSHRRISLLIYVSPHGQSRSLSFNPFNSFFFISFTFLSVFGIFKSIIIYITINYCSTFNIHKHMTLTTTAREMKNFNFGHEMKAKGIVSFFLHTHWTIDEGQFCALCELCYGTWVILISFRKNG